MDGVISTTDSERSEAKPKGEVTPLKEQMQQIPSGSGAGKPQDGLRNIIISFSVFSAVVTIALLIQIIVGEPEMSPHGGVSSCDERCSNMGVDVMESGGSAVDAAITTMLCVGLVNPDYAGIGGGGFMIIHDHSAKAALSEHDVNMLIDFRETAPLNVDALKDKVLTEDGGRFGGAFVGVPGELKGMSEAHNKFGKLPWSRLFRPVVHLARRGFALSESFFDSVYHRRSLGPADEDQMNKFLENFANQYADGKRLEPGTIVKRPDYAQVLDDVGKLGIEVFYKGKYAEEIVSAVNEKNGSISKDDMLNYKIVVRKPLIGYFRDYEIMTVPAPGSGSLLIHILNQLDDMKAWQWSEEKFLEEFPEILRTVAAARKFLGDPMFAPAVGTLEASFIISNNPNSITTPKPEADSEEEADNSSSPAFASDIESETAEVGSTGDASVVVSDDADLPAHPNDELGAKLRKRRWDRHMLENGGGNAEWKDYGTSHVSVIDQNELMVSVTHTMNHWFGSFVSTKSGIYLNNQLADFYFGPGDSNNKIKGGKRPLSSMVPTIVHHVKKLCSRRIAIGGTNGTKIVSGVANVLFHVLGHNMTLKDSILVPRIYCSVDQCNQEIYTDEHGFIGALSIVQAVMKNNDTISAFADPRNGGVAAEF